MKRSAEFQDKGDCVIGSGDLHVFGVQLEWDALGTTAYAGSECT